ncbi:hypothetical protein JNL27_14615 [bacterium]|nr:hypothetical protein [bacterium]
MKTSNKHPKRRPAKPFKGIESSTNPFSKDRQPSPEAKSAGWLKKRTLKELLAMELSGTDKSAALVRSFVSKYLGVKESEVGNEITLEIAMHLRQIEKAIAKGDTRAYEVLNERAYGKNISVDVNAGLVDTKTLFPNEESIKAHTAYLIALGAPEEKK